MIEGALTNSFKLELLQGIHDFRVDTFKMALFTRNAMIGRETAAYAAGNAEASGVGYPPGGVQILVASGYPKLDPLSGQAWLRFADLAFPSMTIECRGALIYNASKQNRSVRTINFGSDQFPVNGPLNIAFPLSQQPTVVIA